MMAALVWLCRALVAVAITGASRPAASQDALELLQVEVAVHEEAEVPWKRRGAVRTTNVNATREGAENTTLATVGNSTHNVPVPREGGLANAPSNASGAGVLVEANRSNASISANLTKADDTRTTTVEANETGWCGYQAQTGFLTAYTKPGSNNLLLDLTDALQGSSKQRIRFVVTAMAVSGTYSDGSGHITEYASPMEETSSTMFEFRLGSDNISVDVHKPTLDLRTSDRQMVAALKRGTGNGRFDNMITYRCGRRQPGSFILKGKGPSAVNLMQRERSLMDSLLEGDRMQEIGVAKEEEDGNATMASTPELRPAEQQRVIINGGYLIRAGFFVAPSVKQATSYRLLGVKVFERNIDVTVEYMMPDNEPISIGFSLVQLPSNPMRPRAADDRVLYFTTDYEDLGEHGQYRDELPEESINRKVSTIWRYNLEALPGNQIRIHIDPTVPRRWRKWFRKGVEAWNEAFTLVGRPEAVRAVLPEDADWPADYDISDARFSTISWTISQQVVSMGIAKVDPRSGEILKSDIIMSDGWVRSWLGDLDLLAPNFTHQLHETAGFRFEARSNGNIILRNRRVPGRLHFGDVDWGKKISLLSLARGKPLDALERDEILGKGLQNVVTHETGHILGLRHNFKGSLGVTYACVRSASCSSVHGLTASVMDYVPVNLPSADAPDVHFFSPVLGGYDKLAIQYGYMEVNSSNVDENETNSRSLLDAELRPILDKAEKYDTCYDADRIAKQDPSCMAYDMSSDPLQAYEDEIQRLVEVQRRLLNTSVMPGAPYTHYGDAVDSILLMSRSIGVKLVDWLGGVSNNYVHRRMDGRYPGKVARVPVPRHTQRRALGLMLKLARPVRASLLPPKESLPYLVSGNGPGNVESLDLELRVRSIARTIVAAALSEGQLLRIHAQEHLAPAPTEHEEGSSDEETRAGVFTCGEFLARFAKGIVGEGLASSMPTEWDLHRFLVRGLGNLYQSSSLPSMVRAHALHQLLRLRKQALTAADTVASDREPLQAVALSRSDEHFEPKQAEVLKAHLAALLQQITSAVCGEGAAHRECVFAGLSSSDVVTRPGPWSLALAAGLVAFQHAAL